MHPVAQLSCALALLIPVLTAESSDDSARGRVTFESPDPALANGFAWAKQQALSYVHSGDPVGDWYDASLPNRDAFCMRDVSHQALGAQILGLAPVTRNLLTKFAQNVAASRQWCSFWEINKNNLPAPVDYKNDKDFWYNLPANFDVLHACYRQYLWTGDASYLQSPIFQNIYQRTTNDYVQAWDDDHDGIPDSHPQYGHRGIPSYNEELAGRPRQVADLLATQYSALLAAARMQKLLKHAATAQQLNNAATHIREIFNRQWWNAGQQSFYTAKLQDGEFYSGRIPEPDFFPVYLEQLPSDGEHLQGQLRVVSEASQNPKVNVEAFSYYPEILYHWGLNDQAYIALTKLLSPSLHRRDYPEVSFAAIGALAAGLMGIQPDAATRTVVTLSHLTSATPSATLSHVPVFDGGITVKHVALSQTQFTNEGRTPISWEAQFAGNVHSLTVDGRRTHACPRVLSGGQNITYTRITVSPGQTVMAQLRRSRAR